jgi:hypothetical protein
LDACRRGFLDGCRRVIWLDGCFLKGPMKGELLSAIGRDANNQIYPIAWAVVEYENKDSWDWFLGHLQKDIHIPIGVEGWVFITDKQKVIFTQNCVVTVHCNTKLSNNIILSIYAGSSKCC